MYDTHFFILKIDFIEGYAYNTFFLIIKLVTKMKETAIVREQSKIDILINCDSKSEVSYKSFKFDGKITFINAEQSTLMEQIQCSNILFKQYRFLFLFFCPAKN